MGLVECGLSRDFGIVTIGLGGGDYRRRATRE